MDKMVGIKLNNTLPSMGCNRTGIPGSVKLFVPVVKVNNKTVWVSLPDGHTIKRHMNKHILTDTEKAGIVIEKIDSEE